MAGVTFSSRRLFAMLMFRLLILTSGTCRLPVILPPAARPVGATMGPENSLILVTSGGTILFVSLEDYGLREDTAWNDKYADGFGACDLEGVAVTEPDSPYLYLAVSGKATIFEYDWNHSRQVKRQFSLPGFAEQGSSAGPVSVSWVPTSASLQFGYFYVGSKLTGKVYIYELPVFDKTESKVVAKLIRIWTPLAGSKDVSSLSYSSGYLFVNYDETSSNHVMIYPVLPTGLPGDLAEQYQVDVVDAKGMAVREMADNSWEIIFTSSSHQALFAYVFKLVSGFELHGHCSGTLTDRSDSGASWQRLVRWETLLIAVVALQITWCSATST